MKQFDCQNMPNSIKKAYFECTQGESNDVWLEFQVSTNPDEYSSNHAKVSKWLIKQKAGKNSKVLIKHWW